MVKKKKPLPKFEERDVHIIREQTYKNQKIQLRLVRWCVDGKTTNMKVEKRRYFITKSGKTVMGKLTGFSKQDMDYLYSNWPDICQLFD